MYKFTLEYNDGRVTSFTILADEKADYVAYCREGIRAGWLVDYEYIYMQESW